MKFRDPKTFLWANICRLLALPDRPSIDVVQTRLGVVGRGTVQRIREGEAATRLDSLTAIADKLEIPTWRLLQDDQECSPEAARLAALCDCITDHAERERFIAVAETYADLAVRGQLAGVLDAMRLVALPPAPTPEPRRHDTLPGDEDRIGRTGPPAAAKSRR